MVILTMINTPYFLYMETYGNVGTFCSFFNKIWKHFQYESVESLKLASVAEQASLCLTFVHGRKAKTNGLLATQLNPF